MLQVLEIMSHLGTYVALMQHMFQFFFVQICFIGEKRSIL